MTTSTKVTTPSKITKAALLKGIKDKTKAVPVAKKIGKRAAAAADPASVARVEKASAALAVLTGMAKDGKVTVVQVIRAIVGNFPLLRREALALLTGAGMNRGTVNTQFQWVRSGKVDVPYLPKHLTK